ncbi:PREDICTED: uncharacterized protein LOC109474882 [Branchiostoma belcheri]|uniref:Uncharacterized protein LOC109474882 n=1 Tax=Branchiostoma belcheri TaxID=7741 RepID=A0A6P4ZMR6_BRABE|nr:PREDICTED: uncharacterized protein LOC109474882 [Branchiostoma belcheri]
MGFLDRTASAFLSVVHVLSLLRPGSKSQIGGIKLNVTVHEGKVGRQSQGKYLVTIRHGKNKVQTAKKKSDALIWEHSTEFVGSPTDQLVLKLRKAKRCKDTTVGELSIDVAAAIESVDGLPQKWWYIMDQPKKGGRRKEEVFLQASVTLEGTEGKSQPTQNQVSVTKPSEETVEASEQGKSETLSELQNHQVKAVAVSLEKVPVAHPDNSAADSSPPAVTGDIADVKQDSSDTALTPDTADEFDTEDKFGVNEDMDVPPNDAHRSSRHTDVTLLHVSGAADNQEREIESEIPKGQVSVTKAPEETVEASAQGEPETLSELQAVAVSLEKDPVAHPDNSAADSSPPSVTGDIADVKQDSSDTALTPDTADEFGVNEDMGVESELPKGRGTYKTSEGTVKTELPEKPEPENGKINVSQETEPGAPLADSGKDSSPPSAAGDAADVSTESSTSSAFGLPASNPDKRPAAGEGDVPERHSPSVVHGKETETPDNIGTDTCSQTTTSTQGGGSSLSTTTPSPKHKDAEDPQYEEVMSSVDKLWAELNFERDYAETLLAHAESLRAKLNTAAPKVLQYPVLKNIAAVVPDRTSYELPDTQGLSLVELQDIQKTLTKAVQEEKERGSYIKRWYWEELVRVALKEAPQVFGPED